MATTTNYSWTTPDDTALVKDGASAIRTLGSSVDTTLKNLNPSTTLGDIEYRSSSANTNTRLPIGTTGQILTVSGGVPAWVSPSGGSLVGCSLHGGGGTQSIGNNITTAITFPNELFDTNGFHSTSTNTSRITIPSGKAGYYLILAQLDYQPGTQSKLQAIIRVNNNGIAATAMTGAGGDFNSSVPVETIQNLAEGDYVELFARQLSGSSINAQMDNQTATRLTAVKIG